METRRRCGRQRRKDLHRRHPGARHQRVFVGGVEIAHVAHVGAEQDLAAAFHERGQFVDRLGRECLGFVSAGGFLRRLVRPQFQRRYQRGVMREHRRDERRRPALRVRVCQNVDARFHGNRRAFDIRRMREHRPAEPVCFGHRRLRDRNRHRFDFAAAHDRTSEQFYGVGAAAEIGVHRLDGLVGRCGLLHQTKQFRRQVAQVNRNAVGRIQRLTGGQDARARDFAGVDALAQRKRVVELRTGIEYRCEAEPRQHAAHLRGQRVRRLLRGACPLRAHEMHVIVVQPGDDDETAAVEGRRGGRRSPGRRRRWCRRARRRSCRAAARCRGRRKPLRREGPAHPRRARRCRWPGRLQRTST